MNKNKIGFVNCDGELYVDFSHCAINPYFWVLNGYKLIKFGNGKTSYISLKDLQEWHEVHEKNPLIVARIKKMLEFWETNKNENNLLWFVEKLLNNKKGK